MQYGDGDERCVVGEEDAIWLLKMLLPYINELLLKFRGLFSGDPATTLKVGFLVLLSESIPCILSLDRQRCVILVTLLWQLAALLFVMARCGSTITVWSLAKLSKLRTWRTNNMSFTLHCKKNMKPTV